MRWLRTSPTLWPLTVRLPLVVALAMFIVALGTTHLGLTLLERRGDLALRESGAAVLDILAGQVGPLLAAGDETAAAQIVAAALSHSTILRQGGIALRYLGDNGDQLALAIPGETQTAALAQAVAAHASGEQTAGEQTAGDAAPGLLLRVYRVEEGRIVMAITPDGGSFREAVGDTRRFAILIDVLVAAIAALITFILVRRAIRPLDAIAMGLMEDPAGGEANPRDTPEIGRLRAAIRARIARESARNEALADFGEKERDALLARLAAGLAHEVRNPLAGLLNAVSTLRRFGHDPQVRQETLDLVERGLRSIERVADTMLSTYRSTPGRAILDLDDVRDLQILVAPEARRRQVALIWEVDEMRPLVIDADAVRQILLNLLLNACKASPEGGTVRLRLTQDARETTFSVTDSGAGMPEDVMAFVSQADQAMPVSRRKRLGLWMVARLVDDVLGRVKIESRSGQGTTVHVALPNNWEAKK